MHNNVRAVKVLGCAAALTVLCFSGCERVEWLTPAEIEDVRDKIPAVYHIKDDDGVDIAFVLVGDGRFVQNVNGSRNLTGKWKVDGSGILLWADSAENIQRSFADVKYWNRDWWTFDLRKINGQTCVLGGATDSPESWSVLRRLK